LGPPPPPDVEPPPVFGTLTDGLGALPQLLAAAIVRLGGAVLLGRTVRSLRRDAAGWHVVHGPTTDERFLMADAVVLAVPAAPASRLLADVAPQGSAELAAIESASVAIVTTAWRSDDVPDVVGTGYLVPAQRDRPVKAVTFSSAKWAHLHRPKLAVVRCSIGRYGEVSDLQRDDDDLVKMASHELTSYAGFRGAPVESRVTRWGGGLPQYAVGHRERVERIRRAVAAQPGLGICGAGYDGVGIPACIRTGRLAAEHVMASLTSLEER
jgi:oxygen-dependent protoporphyrinogen oxidase